MEDCFCHRIKKFIYIYIYLSFILQFWLFFLQFWGEYNRRARCFARYIFATNLQFWKEKSELWKNIKNCDFVILGLLQLWQKRNKREKSSNYLFYSVAKTNKQTKTMRSQLRIARNTRIRFLFYFSSKFKMYILQFKDRAVRKKNCET